MNEFDLIQIITMLVATLLLSAVFGVSWVTQRYEQRGIDRRRLR